MEDGETDAIRAAQRHIRRSGFDEDILHVAGYLETLIHGTTFAASGEIAAEGIRRQDRLHVHFWGSDMEGNHWVAGIISVYHRKWRMWCRPRGARDTALAVIAHQAV